MKLCLVELTDTSSPLALRRRGLVQLSGLTLALQLLHLTVAWLAIPALWDLPWWAGWAVSGFFGAVLLAIGVVAARPSTRRPHLEPVRQIFLAALWLGVACLAAIFAARLAFGLGVVLFLTFALVGYGIAFGRLWFGLSKA